jgi:hypothetical protein
VEAESNAVQVNSTTRTFIDRAPTARTSATGLYGDTPSFESQLSAALAESLQKLGVTGGEVNISIRNPSSSTRQIVVTYSTDATLAATPSPAATPTPTKAANPVVATPTFNPFTISVPYIAPPVVVEDFGMPWCPPEGPKDIRDELPKGGGQVTASGAPSISLNEKGAGNQSGYTGPAAKNPYFSTPSNPLRPGYVLGFDKWFEYPQILGGPNGPQPGNRFQYATEEGAKEALRIVQMFAPEATMVKTMWRSGPYAVDTPQYDIQLTPGRFLNAGGVLTSYYREGYGVVASADETIRHAIQIA